MKIKTVAIIGAGAIGSYFIAGLTEKLGDDLWIVAEGERKERLEKNGIVINDQKYDLQDVYKRQGSSRPLFRSTVPIPFLLTDFYSWVRQEPVNPRLPMRWQES